jgi:hypothetical protein
MKNLCFVCNKIHVSEIDGMWLHIKNEIKPICDTCTYVPPKPKHSVCPSCGDYRPYDEKEFCSRTCTIYFLDLEEI